MTWSRLEVKPGNSLAFEIIVWRIHASTTDTIYRKHQTICMWKQGSRDFRHKIYYQVLKRHVLSSNHHQQEHLASNFIGCLWSTNGRDANTSYASSKCGLMRLMHNLQGSNWSCREKCKGRDLTPLRFSVSWYVRPISSLVTWAKEPTVHLIYSKNIMLGWLCLYFLA